MDITFAPLPENHMDRLYNSKNPLVKFVQRNRLNKIAEFMPASNKLKILDAGCGEGHLIEKLNQKNSQNYYYGIDLTKVAINSAEKRCPRAKIFLMDLTKLKFKDNFFDIVICSDVLEHIPRYRLAIEELKRVTKKNGFLIITFPNEILWTISRFFLGRIPFKIPDHFNSFTPQKMKSQVGIKSGLQISIPFNLPFFLSLGVLIQFKK
ncbi:class I SAM-dependent methyltransferase [Candidatus Woesearchaeota archaeon]|nr:class I SAM-dependent methyltransferase [Candidatus Woesearchaeota archaeon]